MVGVAALVLSGCGAPNGEDADAEGAADDQTDSSAETAEAEATPSNEPSAENPTSAEEVDLDSDVALRAVNTALNDQEGQATSYIKDSGDDVGMEVDILVDGEQLSTLVTNQEGTGIVDTRDGGAADDELAEIAAEAEVPLLRAMEIAQSESAGVILEARLEPREDDLIVWVVEVEGLSTENTVVLDARNGAVVPEGERPMDENGIGADPGTVDQDDR